jgi:hypothetical protein
MAFIMKTQTNYGHHRPFDSKWVRSTIVLEFLATDAIIAAFLVGILGTRFSKEPLT